MPKYTPRLKPRAHQVEALRRVKEKPSSPSDQDVFALLMEMGTGKSKVVCDEFAERVEAKELTDLLIFAPAGCYRNWDYDRGEDEPSELRKQIHPELYDKMVIAPWVSGMNKAARDRLAAMLACRDRPRALVVNVEAMGVVKKAQEAVEEFVSRGRTLAVVDESTTIKNRRAHRTRRIFELTRKAPARRIMSGLVAPRSPLDLYAQFQFLDWRILGHRAYQSFQSRYAITRPMEVGGGGWHPRVIQQIVGYRNVEELHELIAPYSFRVLKENCLDLPKKQYLPLRDVPLTDEQRRIYNEIKLFATSQLASESYVTATMVLTQRIRLDQVLCGFVADESGNFHEIPERRTDTLLEVIDEVEGKVIVWTSHDYSVRKISDRLRREYGDDSVAQFWGGNRATRGADERRFKQDPACRFMVATPAAGGRGNTWVGAGLSVYYNNADDLEQRLQSEDRTHRDGLTAPGGAGRADYVDLCARGTLDERKIKSLRAKLDISTLINGDNYREWLV